MTYDHQDLADAGTPVIAADPTAARKKSRPRKPSKNYLTTFFWDDKATLVYQLNCGSVPVCRRKDNNFVNGTKLLNISPISRGKRDSMLKHEKDRDVIKKGPFRLKGIWIPFERAIQLAGEIGIISEACPLFDKNPESLVLSSESVSSIAASRTLSGSSAEENSEQPETATPESAPKAKATKNRASAAPSSKPSAAPSKSSAAPNEESVKADCPIQEENKRRLTMTLRSHSFNKQGESQGMAHLTREHPQTDKDSPSMSPVSSADGDTPTGGPVSPRRTTAAPTDNSMLLATPMYTPLPPSISSSHSLHSLDASTGPSYPSLKATPTTMMHHPNIGATSFFSPTATDTMTGFTLAQLTPQFSPYAMHPYYPGHELAIFPHSGIFAPDFSSAGASPFLATSDEAAPQQLGSIFASYPGYQRLDYAAPNAVGKRTMHDSHDFDHATTKRARSATNTGGPKSFPSSLGLFRMETCAPTTVAELQIPVLTTEPSNPFDHASEVTVVSSSVNICNAPAAGHISREFALIDKAAKAATTSAQATVSPFAVEMLEQDYARPCSVEFEPLSILAHILT
ncbi:hypothetical protein RI367_007215 [Sorochytrium milnesiophthora]